MSVEWGLVVEQTELQVCSTVVLEHVTGTREDALDRLEEIARSFTPHYARNSTKKRLYRTAEGFLLVSEGAMFSYGCRFSVVELAWDGVAEQEAAAAAREEERRARAEQRAERRAQRGSRWRR
ncbi:hypothetical protein [Streptomyces sp. B6B3]|uniref:hypothetical protein n=1 Tax=Streptomyces sp. B6B3 TaxID=3153570 RepID=UPI00325DF0EF